MTDGCIVYYWTGSFCNRRGAEVARCPQDSHSAEYSTKVGHQKFIDQQVACISSGSTGDLLIYTFLVT